MGIDFLISSLSEDSDKGTLSPPTQTREVNAGRWLSVTVAGSSFQLSHLMFADDLLLLTRASEHQVEVMRDTLAKFCKVSGMKVNVAKSRVLGQRNIQNTLKERVVSITSIQFTQEIGKYLDFPIFCKRMTKHDF